MNNSYSEFNFKSSSTIRNKKHSVSMYQIQQQQLIDSSDKNESITSTITTTTTSKSTFVRHTAGSFDLNVNNLNLNESQSNLKIYIETQQQQQQPQKQICSNLDRLPIDSALTTTASALAASNSFNSTYLDSPTSFSRPNTSLGVYESYDNNFDDFKSKLTSSNSEFTLKYNNNTDDKLNLSYNEFNNNNNKNNSILIDESINSIDLINNQEQELDTIETLQVETDKTSKELKTKAKKSKKTSAFAWVGRTVGRRMNKNYYTHHHTNHTRRHQSPLNNLNSTLNSSLPTASDFTDTTTVLTTIMTTTVTPPTPPPTTTTTMSATATATATTSTSKSKKIFKIDWTESAKQGVHMWSDVNNNQSVDSCYLNEPDALEFHQIKSNYKCESSSKGESKKKCLICKIVVHETCIEKLQHYVKCRTTFREATGRKKSFRDKESSSINSSLVNYHHWICRKYDENNSNKCQSCFKSYTNRFGMHTSRTIISCSWCKMSYHMKCFSDELLKDACHFGELSPLIVPPSWIVKSSLNKNSIRLSHLLKPYHRTSKRVHQQLDNSPSRKVSNEINANATVNLSNSDQSTTSNNNLLNVSNLSHQVSFRSAYKPFIIRPPSSNLGPSFTNLSSKPLLVLINPKSGGKLGPKLLKKFGYHLNARQVFDLTQSGCPRFPLHLYRNVPNLRLLVGGGDGTVGWVLSVIDQINFLISPPAVAVLPLGTGNDLARALNWGSVYTDEPLSKILTKVMESRIVKLDRWKITTEVNTEVDVSTLNDNSENAIDKLKNDVMNNYFSLGADAHICLEFHERREANPQKFTSRWFNILNYVESGSKDMIKKSWKDLKDYVKLECDNKSYTELIRSRGYHFIIFLNISKYSGGTNPWGSSSNDSNFQAQSMNDGKIEVIGCFSSTLAKIHIGGAGERICQAKYIRLTTSTYIPIQIDGEPAKLAPSIIEIKHKNQAYMLEHVKYNIDSPITDYNPSIHKSFQVKCILENDYEHLRKLKTPDLVKNKAIHIGTIYTSNLGDNLPQVRNTINALIRDSSSGFTTSKWSFLNGEEFYRINEEADDALLCETVSANGTIFILDEETNKSDFLFAKARDDLEVDDSKRDGYEDEDLEDEIEDETNNQLEQMQPEKALSSQMLTNNKHLHLSDKLRSSQSSPKIFDNNKQLAHAQSKTISSSKSTQFLSIASKSDQFV